MSLPPEQLAAIEDPALQMAKRAWEIAQEYCDPKALGGLPKRPYYLAYIPPDLVVHFLCGKTGYSSKQTVGWVAERWGEVEKRLKEKSGLRMAEKLLLFYFVGVSTCWSFYMSLNLWLKELLEEGTPPDLLSVSISLLPAVLALYIGDTLKELVKEKRLRTSRRLLSLAINAALIDTFLSPDEAKKFIEEKIPPIAELSLKLERTPSGDA